MYDAPLDLQIITFLPSKYSINQSISVSIFSAGLFPYLKYCLINYKNEIFVIILTTILSWEPLCSIIVSLIIAWHDTFIEFIVIGVIGFILGMSI